MNNAFHIAGREFSDNARTKGFWINMLMFPIMILASVKVPQLLEEKAKPTRHFVLVDQSGQFEAVVDTSVEKHYQRTVAKKLFEYMQENAKEGSAGGGMTAEMLETLPANQFDLSFLQDGDDAVLQMLEDQDPRIVQMLGTPGGLDAILPILYGMLKPNPPEFEPPRRMLARAEVPEGLWGDLDPATADPADLVERMKPYLKGDADFGDHKNPLFAFVVIPSDALQQIKRPGIDPLDNGEQLRRGVQFWSTNLTDKDLANLIERSINDDVHLREYDARGIDPNEIMEVRRTKMRFTSFDPKKAEGEEVVSLADTIRKWAPIGFVYLLWVAIFTVVQMLLNNTVEEKSNRIIEVLLSSATPWEIMAGKLIGIACVGLTMMVAWILSLIGVLKYLAGPTVEWAGMVLEVIQNSGLLPLFALYFVAGYLTYAGIFLAIGSLCSTVKEAQNFMGTAMIILMVPLFTMVFVAQDPHGTLATFLTWVPLYTPFVMMNRAAADPPMFDLVGTGILMTVTVIGMLWLSSRIFRIGVLRTGQPPKLLELLRSLGTPLSQQ